jgi:F0F1-type ATP synthase membrane subunit a
VGIADQINPSTPTEIWGMTFNMTTVYMSVLVSLLLCFVAVLATRRMRRVPGRFQAFVESMASFFYEIVEQALGREHNRYSPDTCA